jgi:hypothetical protein
MIQTLAISLAAALLFAIATGSARAQKAKGTDISPWTVTHGTNTGSQKKPAKGLKAKTVPKKGIQVGTSDLQNAESVRSQKKKNKGLQSKQP